MPRRERERETETVAILAQVSHPCGNPAVTRGTLWGALAAEASNRMDQAILARFRARSTTAGRPKANSSEDEGETTQHSQLTPHYEDPQNKKLLEYLEDQQNYEEHPAPLPLLHPFKGNSEVETQERTRYRFEAPAKSNRRHTKEDAKTEILLLLLLVHKSEDKTTAIGVIFESTSHTTTKADVRWTCDKGTERPGDGRGAQRHPQLGGTFATTGATPKQEGNPTRDRPNPSWSSAGLGSLCRCGGNSTRQPGGSTAQQDG